ncbi:MAG: hypothetical protein MR460_10015 [Bilophila wadsworthia]|uniref:hypothetical protein n=1 Tax=Bilophila wadsworthia TaxID=35833 RepID=UPI00242D173A|nr:hypothetical protein [Bilophila wadsworthia]MCI6540457.1 hypothetical protein [Bilophila wadsworthia]
MGRLFPFGSHHRGKQMDETNRNTGTEGLLEILRCGLERDAERRTAIRFGARTRYVGLSDIAKMLDCPRAALAAKLYTTEQENTAEALKRQITLQRGHWFETGIHQALMGYGLSPLSQLEIELMHGDVLLKAHLDFTLIATQPQPTVRILEVKSTARLPVTLSESYAMQISGQTALLKAYWNHPVFNLVLDTGEVLHHRTFPEICNECLGVSLPEASACDIQGWMVCLSMCDAKVFGPFLPEDTDVTRCLDMASEFWETMNDLRENKVNLNAVPTAQGLAPLCPSCFWKDDCPRFKGSSHPEWEATLAQLINLKTQKKVLEEEIGELESRLKVAYQLSHTVRGEWINTGKHTFRVIPQNGRVTLDRKRLNEELETLLGEQDARTLLARCEKQGEPFERLYAIRI